MKTIFVLILAIGFTGSVGKLIADPGLMLEIKKEFAGGVVWKVIRESSTFTPPPVEAKNWTNTEAESIASIGRPLGACRKDIYVPILEVQGGSRTHRELALNMVLHTSIPSMRIRDFLIETNKAVYICDSFFFTKVTGQPDLLAIIVTPPSGTNALPTTSAHLLWHALSGSFSESRNVKMSGSMEDDTLEITLISITGMSTTAQTNRYQNGKWVITMGKPKPLDNSKTY